MSGHRILLHLSVSETVLSIEGVNRMMKLERTPMPDITVITGNVIDRRCGAMRSFAGVSLCLL